MANKWIEKLAKAEGAVVGDYNPYSHVIRSGSPSLNFTFGNTHGLPLGFTLVVYGPPKGGKSLIAKSFMGQLHKDDPDALVVKFDTEFREEAQNQDLRAADQNAWGIDPDRYIAYSVNAPKLIFDHIEKNISAMCDDGAPIKLIVIDSLNSIIGRRMENADSIDKMQIGDLALTLQDGLKRILHVQRKHRIAMILTSHVRAEMDQTEIMRGNKVKMGASFAVKHHAEYFMYVEPNRTVGGRTDLLGKEFTDETKTDLAGREAKTAVKHRACMKETSVGAPGRTGEFTVDLTRSGMMINHHEEVFLLGVNQGIIERPNAQTYRFGGKDWRGKPAMVEGLRTDPELQQAILKELRRRDVEGVLAAPVEVAVAPEEVSA